MAGLDYMHARYYSLASGRFSATDPIDSGSIGSGQTWNKNSYALNDPISRHDPDGAMDRVFTLNLKLEAQKIMSPAEYRKYSQTNARRGMIAGLAGLSAGIGAAVALEALPILTTFALSPQAQNLASTTSQILNPNPGGSLVPVGTVPLGAWGETHLGRVLDWAGVKPSKAFVTSYGSRFIDRLVDGIGHEAKAGLNVGLNSKIKTQILKDAELIVSGRLRGAHWHFFRGVKQEVLDFLSNNRIEYTVHNKK
jgi:RHS repeat-associated protein